MNAKLSEEIAEQEPQSESQFPSIVERILLGVDAGLDFYGKNVKDIFYAEMEATQCLKRSEIVANPETFEKSLQLFFLSGTTIVDRSIGRGILRQFDLPLSAGLTFRTAVEIVKRHPHQ
jgi:hypothetical protein